MENKNHEDKLGLTEENMTDHIVDIANSGKNVISTEYIRPIAERIVKAVMVDMVETADNECWTDDDVRLAVGRAICDFLKIEH